MFRNSIPIGYVTKVEVYVPTLRRNIPLTRDSRRNFFEVQVEKASFVPARGSGVYNVERLEA